MQAFVDHSSPLARTDVDALAVAATHDIVTHFDVADPTTVTKDTPQRLQQMVRELTRVCTESETVQHPDGARSERIRKIITTYRDVPVYVPRSAPTTDTEQDDGEETGSSDEATPVDHCMNSMRCIIDDLVSELQRDNGSMRREIETMRRQIHDLKSQNASLNDELTCLTEFLCLQTACKRPRIMGPDGVTEDVTTSSDESESIVDEETQDEEYDEDEALLDEMLNETERRVDRHKELKMESRVYVGKCMDAFRSMSISHIDIKPVFLGAHPQFADMRGLVSTKDLHRNIVKVFENMLPAEYATHPLRHFFEEDKSKVFRYIPKYYTTAVSKKTQRVMQIDHVLSKSWSGPDHPRNFMVMHAAMNRRFGDKAPEWKMAYLSDNSHGVDVIAYVKKYLRHRREYKYYKSMDKMYHRKGIQNIADM